MKGRSANLRMIRTNYLNIYSNYRRIAARATRRCWLATRENSRESGPQRRLIAPPLSPSPPLQNQPATGTLAVTCSRISIREVFVARDVDVCIPRYKSMSRLRRESVNETREFELD